MSRHLKKDCQMYSWIIYQRTKEILLHCYHIYDVRSFYLVHHYTLTVKDLNKSKGGLFYKVTGFKFARRSNGQLDNTNQAFILSSSKQTCYVHAYEDSIFPTESLCVFFKCRQFVSRPPLDLGHAILLVSNMNEASWTAKQQARQTAAQHPAAT